MGVCHEIFDLHFFQDSNPSRPPINRQKYFRIRLWFRRDIQIFKKLRSVHHTPESKLRGVLPTAESNSTVCITPQSQTPQCDSQCGVRLRSVHHTTESSFAVCIILLSLNPRWASHSQVSTYQVSVVFWF